MISKITVIAILTAALFVGAPMLVFADHKSGNNINVTVNCLNGTQVQKHLHHDGGSNVNVNVTCSGGGTPIPGPPGKPGANATITLCTDNSTSALCR